MESCLKFFFLHQKSAFIQVMISLGRCWLWPLLFAGLESHLTNIGRKLFQGCLVPAGQCLQGRGVHPAQLGQLDGVLLELFSRGLEHPHGLGHLLLGDSGIKGIAELEVEASPEADVLLAPARVQVPELLADAMVLLEAGQ